MLAPSWVATSFANWQKGSDLDVAAVRIHQSIEGWNLQLKVSQDVEAHRLAPFIGLRIAISGIEPRTFFCSAHYRASGFRQDSSKANELNSGTSKTNHEPYHGPRWDLLERSRSPMYPSRFISTCQRQTVGKDQRKITTISRNPEETLERILVSPDVL